MALIYALVFLLALTTEIVIHEFGHAIVGRALRFKIYDISIGWGRTIFRCSILGLPVTVRLLPFGGLTRLASSTERFFRARLWLSIFAGPATHLATLWIIYAAFGWPRVEDSIGKLIMGQLTMLGIVLFATAEGLIFNLLPFKVTHGMGLLRSDGYLLVTVPFMGDERQTAYRALYPEYEARKLMEAGRTKEALEVFRQAVGICPSSVSASIGLHTAHLRLRQTAKAREVLVALLAQKDSARGNIRRSLMNDIAWFDIMLNDPALLDEADRYSKQAFGKRPKNPSFNRTRGAVLVSLGRADEGIELLAKAHRRHKIRWARGAVSYFLAAGEAHRGNVAEAKTWLALGIRDYRDDRLRERAEAEIEKASEGAIGAEAGM